VEADQIAVEKRPENVLTHRQGPVYLRGRKRVVQEEPQLHAVEPLPEESGEDHEVVIMDPDKILVWVDNLGDLVGEDLVGQDVGLPLLTVEARALARRHGQHVVEERPQVMLAETMIEFVVNLWG